MKRKILLHLGVPSTDGGDLVSQLSHVFRRFGVYCLDKFNSRLRLVCKVNDEATEGMRETMLKDKERVSFADLKNASPSERRRLIAYIAEKASEPANGRLGEVRSEIARFEGEYGMTSKSFLEELYFGRRRETDDILPWLRLLRLKDLLESKGS